MHPDSPFVSALIPYRNREVARLQRCLRSLAAQSYAHFEVILVDFGSEEENSHNIRQLCSSYSFCKYHFIQARGLFWNKSKALNFAIKESSGTQMLIVDADLIFHPGFLEKAIKQLKEGCFLNYVCHYLPEKFEEYENVFKKDFTRICTKSNSSSAQGLLMVSKEEILLTGGYDEFYRIWGGEDRDMVLCLESQDLQQIIVDFEETPVFHQWHPKVSAQLPKGWIQTYEKHLAKKKLLFVNEKKKLWNNPTDKGNFNERPALELYIKQNLLPDKSFTFHFPIEQSYASFFSVFSSLEKGEYLFVSQEFEKIALKRHSRWGRWVNRFNRWLKLGDISYRWVEIETWETEFISCKQVYHFLFYFLLHNEKTITDHFLIDEENKIQFILVK